LLACIVKDGMRTGDIVDRTRALIKKSRDDGKHNLISVLK
jgi:hypothetical protein